MHQITYFPDINWTAVLSYILYQALKVLRSLYKKSLGIKTQAAMTGIER
jgi:hypothetical protein